MRKCRVVICDYQILSPEGFTDFLCTTRSYIGLGLVQNKTGPVLVPQYSEIFRTGPVPVFLKLG